MNLTSLYLRLEHMPMLKILVPVVAGMALAAAVELPLWFLVAMFALTGAVALLLRSSLMLVAALFVAGFAWAQLREPTEALPHNIRSAWHLEVEGLPSQRGAYTTVEARVVAWRDPQGGEWHTATERLFLRADSTVALNHGDRILCHGFVRPFRGEGSYTTLMHYRGFAGTLFLNERNILEQIPSRHRSLHSRAAACLHGLPLDKDSGAVVRAMVAGDRSGVSAELRDTYSRSGFSHLLALSGLHTGILFMLVNLLTRRLALLRYGHLWRNMLAVAAVWLFVAAAGFPASAVRAAVMCSFLQLALASASEYVAMNALATAAVVMLAWNPAWLHDVGFRLSFTAVAAILAWGVPLCRICRTHSRVVNGLTSAWIIGFVATLATAPLVSHTFGILSVAGLLTGPVAIMVATVVVLAGVVRMVLPIAFLAPVFEWPAVVAARCVNTLAQLTESIPCGTLDFRLSTSAMTALYTLFVVATLAAWCREEKKDEGLC